MEYKIILTGKLTGQIHPIGTSFPQLARHSAKTPVLTLVYEEPIVNQQEMEDYHQSFSSMVYHLYAKFMGNVSLISSHTGKDEQILIDTFFLQDGDPRELPDESSTIENDTEIVESSENISFPDFPTYPPEDDVYIEPDETITPQ